MSTTGKNLHPASVAKRRRQAAWLTKRGWKLGEIARELRVSVRTVERYRAHRQAGAGR
ncbi:helix-turn-helix domain-containing protein [Actinoplanes sp. NPDC051513]|uniref:helix-turn-helix domain-containing protein n=1 Tax=Actinoplanes sp. NPDC051513 TaxID=3363908 RepID=UPI0037A31FBD